MNKTDENEIIAYAMEFEGAWSDDPDDPGGATNFGIILPILRQMGLAGDLDGDGDIDVDDLRKMTRTQAIEVYRTVMLKPMRMDLLLGKYCPLSVCVKYFDIRVNMGPYQASTIFQRAINAACVTQSAHSLGLDIERVPVAIDGIVGKQTRAALGGLNFNSLVALNGFMASEQAGVYRMIAQRKPTMKKFLDGWLRRGYSQYGCVIKNATGLA